MAFSSKNSPKISESLNKIELSLSQTEKRESSLERPRKAMHLQNSIYETDEKQCKSNLTLLNYITNFSERKSSNKTVFLSSKPEIYEYTLCMVNKHEENANLSFISDFDLEDDENNINNSFDSCFNDHSVEQIEIKTKPNKKLLNNINNEDTEIDLEFEKEWNDILDSIVDKKTYQ